MNIDTARKLDYYLGIPLCFLGTLAAKAAGIFSSKNIGLKPKNILFIELSEMGSVILADPAMRKLKKTLGAELYFATFRKNSPSLDILKTVPSENIFAFPDSGLLDMAAGTLQFLRWARNKHIDTVFDLELFSRFTALLTGFSGASRRIGFHGFFHEGLYRGDFLSHRVAYNTHMHIAKNFVALVNALLSEKPETPYSKTVIADDDIALYKISVTKEAIASMQERIRTVFSGYDAKKHRIIIFNTNASDLVPLRCWPRENYISLAKMILDTCSEAIIILTGTASEQAYNDEIAYAINTPPPSPRCINFAGKTAIAELIALYSISSFMLTNDSGPAHFASVTGMPLYVFFGPETPALYGPLSSSFTPLYTGLACSPCITAMNHRKSACHDNICLQVITPQEVFSILDKELS